MGSKLKAFFLLLYSKLQYSILNNKNTLVNLSISESFLLDIQNFTYYAFPSFSTSRDIFTGQYRGSPHFVISQFVISYFMILFWASFHDFEEKIRFIFQIFFFSEFFLKFLFAVFVWTQWLSSDEYLDFLVRHENYKKFIKNADLEFLDPFWGFTPKTASGRHALCSSWLLFKTRNREILYTLLFYQIEP